jgi:polyhydroxyalkanoate synthase subunit PhaC
MDKSGNGEANIKKPEKSRAGVALRNKAKANGSGQSSTTRALPESGKGNGELSSASVPAVQPPDPQPTLFEAIDRVAHARVARATSGVAPSVLVEAWTDWAVHLAVSPGKQLELTTSAVETARAFWADAFGLSGRAAHEEIQADKRFAHADWKKYPFSVWSRAHQRNWQWWQDAMTGVHGVAPPHENLMAFVTGLLVDMTAPSNFAATNPEVISATREQLGQNLVRGARNLSEDIARRSGQQGSAGPQAFEVGRNLAATPGKVVFRNHLIELIQYEPTTTKVHSEPILIVPAWIMKYYILDLSPENSFVRYLVGEGFTVFMVSWKNPDTDDRDLSMEDYRRLGVMQAVDAVQAISKSEQMHAVGYCLGGTLLAIAAAAMARDGDGRFATLSFLAAQIDFTEAGELRLFINDSQVTLIEDMMSAAGFLSSDQMVATFALLRARDLVWAPMIRDYLLGERGSSFDLMAWNADATRMPFRMHSDYLRQLFLDNDLTEGRYRVGDKAIAVSDIRVPIFVVGTEDDHVAPWRSVYKFSVFADTDMTFVLTSGGHNAGIVSEPGHANRHYRIADTPDCAAYRDPSDWLAETAPLAGSWWPSIATWLSRHSGEQGPAPTMGLPSGKCAVIGAAPGEYVLQK